MDAWLLPVLALGGLTLVESVALAVVLHRLSALYSWLYGTLPAPPDKTGIAVGTTVPDFAGTDQQGTRWSAANLRGYGYVLVLTNPHCKYCHEVLPLLESAGKEYGDRVPILLATAADSAQARRYAENRGISLPLMSLDEAANVQFGTTWTPFAFAIDGTGVVRAKGVVRLAPANIGYFAQIVAGPSRQPTTAATATPAEH